MARNMAKRPFFQSLDDDDVLCSFWRHRVCDGGDDDCFSLQ